MAKKLREELARKIDPKLRMIRNGSLEVNLIRAEHSANIAAKSERVSNSVALVRDELSAPIAMRELPKSAKRGRLKEVPSDILVNVFVGVEGRSGSKRVPGETGRQGDLATACVKLSELADVAAREGVSSIELGEPIKVPRPVLGASSSRAPAGRAPRNPPGVSHRGGQDVLVGIIDVQGFDFAHPDFLDSNGKTRFERIWDQGGNARPAPSSSSPYNFGAEFRKEHLDAAISAAGGVGVPAYELEPQSQLASGSHGTHVASIAAGNRGVCPKAKLAGVLISIPKEDSDRRLSFYDSTRIAHAVGYLFDLADELGCKAVSINVSLGTNGHAHDASSAVSRWVDHALATPGRGICVAAGNAGQEAPEHPDDIGYVVGRIHTSGLIEAAGLSEDIELVVVGNTIADISENELELWYEPQDRFAVAVRPPDSSEWIGPIEPGEFIENRQLDDGSFLSVYNELYHPANGNNYIGIFLSPFLSDAGVVGVPAGTWTVRLFGRDIRDGRYHGWIERDDPRPIGRVADKELWSFPSFFTTLSNVDDSSVSSLACGRNVISVGNLDRVANRVNISSSQGPTRDGRTKPEVLADGTDVVAANGFDPDEEWIAMTGTSMASPYVAGVVGLMLSVEPKLTAAQIRGIIQRTATPLPGADFQWRTDAGFGVIDAEACLREAAHAFQKKDLTE